jgi:hypothetical protein
VKAFHSLAFWVIQLAIVYLLYKGWRRESDGRAAVAFAIAAGESAIYAGNGFRCPLTGLAEELGSEHGRVTDIFLPRWLASNVARIYVAGMVLHGRNLHRSEGRGVLRQAFFALAPAADWERCAGAARTVQFGAECRLWCSNHLTPRHAGVSLRSH